MYSMYGALERIMQNSTVVTSPLWALKMLYYRDF